MLILDYDWNNNHLYWSDFIQIVMHNDKLKQHLCAKENMKADPNLEINRLIEA